MSFLIVQNVNKDFSGLKVLTDVNIELQKGENSLEIRVVNSWYNRVAGDQIFPNKKQYTSTNIDLKYDFRGKSINEIPLEPSGLLGPVKIVGNVE